MIEDHAEHRVSSCPVHFVWDGLGSGRMCVRWGFWGLTLALALLSLGRWLHLDLPQQAGHVLATVSGLAYLLGQALSAAVRLQTRRL